MSIKMSIKTSDKYVTPSVANISADELMDKTYPSFPGKTVLVQICDPGKEPIKTSVSSFAKIHAFKYFPTFSNFPNKDTSLTKEIADSILTAVEEAYYDNCNIIFQCNAGSIRSATLTEVAAFLFGFDFKPGKFFDPSYADARVLTRVWTEKVEKRKFAEERSKKLQSVVKLLESSNRSKYKGYLTKEEAEERLKLTGSVTTIEYRSSSDQTHWCFTDNHCFGYNTDSSKLLGFTSTTTGLPMMVVPRPDLPEGFVQTVEDYMIVFHGQNTDHHLESYESFVSFIADNELFE